MSRAFVTEDNDAPPPPPPERPVRPALNLVTPRGARLIEEAILTLNGQLAATSDEAALSLLRRDLRYWVARRTTMQVVAPDPEPQTFGFGVRATIRRGGSVSEIGVVGEDEANPATGLIAWTAPLARALDGAEPGEVVEFEAGGRLDPVTVVKIAPGGE